MSGSANANWRTRKFSIEKAHPKNFDVLRELVLIRSTLIAFPPHRRMWLLFSPTSSFSDRFSLIPLLSFFFQFSFPPPFLLFIPETLINISRSTYKFFSSCKIHSAAFTPRSLSFARKITQQIVSSWMKFLLEIAEKLHP